MIEIDSELERKLRGKFVRIDAESPPQALINFRPTSVRRRHRRLNFIVAAGAIAVVAAGVAAFGLELSGHPHATPTPSTAGRVALPKLPVYSPASPIPKLIEPTPMPAYGTGFPASWYTVVPVTKHTGSAVLPAFIPGGWVYVQYACVGSGNLKIESSDGTVNESLKPCSSSARPVNAQISGAYGPLSGGPVALRVVTNPSVRWEMVVAQTGTPDALPQLPALPAGAKVLVPLTFGQGVAALPSYPYHASIQIQWWCSGPGAISVDISNGNESMGSSVCGVGGSGGTVNFTGPRQTLVVDVSPHNRWEIRVYWEPS
jgi:hypothetical protein